MKIVAVYLAAGSSRRMGHNKLALPFGGCSLGSTALFTLIDSDIEKVIVVTNDLDNHKWISPSLKESKKCYFTDNPKADEGQSYSLTFGVKQAITFGADAVMVVLADQPFVLKETMNQLIACFKYNKYDFVATSLNGVIGPPLIFSKTLFPQLLQLRGDKGARRMIRGSLRDRGMVIESNDDDSFFDIDTETDYLQAIKIMKRRGLH